MCEATDGGYWAFGYGNNGSYNIALVTKWAMDGTHEWTRTYGSSSDYGYYWNGIGTDDGGVIAVGYTRSYGPYAGTNYSWIASKISSSGSVVWTTVWGGGSANNYAYSIDESADGNFIALGRTYGFGPGTGVANYTLTKITPTGSILFNKVYGGIDYDYG